MPQKHFDDQFDDEEVLFVFRKHPVVMRMGLLLGSAALLAGPLYTLILMYAKPNDMPSMGFFWMSLLLSFVAGLIIFFPSWIGWYFSVFIITDKRLIQITQKGLFHRSVIDMSLNQIRMVNYQVAGLTETMLGFGTIMMQTSVGDLVVHEIHHPAKIQKKLLEILRGAGVNATAYDDTDIEQQEGTEEESYER